MRCGMATVGGDRTSRRCTSPTAKSALEPAPGGYSVAPDPVTAQEGHPSVSDLLFHECELANLRSGAQCPQLHKISKDFAVEILDALGDTWILEAGTIRAWLRS